MASSERRAKRERPEPAVLENATLLRKLLHHQAARKAGQDVGVEERMCEQQLHDNLTAAVLRVPPKSVASKAAIAAFKRQHVLMSELAASATLTPNPEPPPPPAPASEPDVKPDVKTE